LKLRLATPTIRAGEKDRRNAPGGCVMKSGFKWVGGALLFTVLNCVQAAAEPKSGIERSADTLLVGIPVAAFGLTFFLNQDVSPLGYDVMHMSGSPRHDLSLALMRATTVTYGLKYSVDEQRPNGESGSFPSGHTAVTFAGAEFIRKEYGWAWGAPAYLAASFVGWSRVATQDHWSHDVLAGAAIGILSNHDYGELHTRWGGLSMAPALLQSSSAVAPGALQVPETAPGIRFEFRF
jgi:membrane-associated phospholipid phosphatase